MNDDFIYPWQENIWEHLVQRYQNQQLPHALLFKGPTGMGKLRLAKSFARWLMCSQHSTSANVSAVSRPCGHCQGCQLMKAGSHPDMLEVLPEAEGKQIQIDSIRQVSSYLSLKSQFAPLQVVIIAPAETMNKYAANSLLKTLEEPTPGSLLILVTSQPSRLLPTIRSRCQTIKFPLPERQQALEWLANQLGSSAGIQQKDLAQLLGLAAGAPLLALDFAHQDTLKSYQQLLGSFEKLAINQSDPVTESKLWESVGLSESVKWMYLWISAMIRLKSGLREVDNQLNWEEPVLERLAQGSDSQRLFQYLDQLIDTQRFVNSQVNVQLMLEALLIQWQQVHR
jgi:DNA polymerase-3 subunit delta'